MVAIGWFLLIVFGIAGTILRGLVLSRLWHWFVVPLGVKEVGITLAIGISLLVTMLTYNPYVAERGEGEKGLPKAFSRFLVSVVMTLIAWGMGAIVAQFL